MTYIRKHARFTILDDVPADVWQEPEEHQHAPLAGTSSDPDKYLCIVGDDPADYHGNFYACTFTAAMYQGEHVPVSADYLRKCTPAPEDVTRKILAFYIRNWSAMENDEIAALLREDADQISKA